MANRITPEMILDQIATENYFTGQAACDALGMPCGRGFAELTICLLGMKNGFIVVGTSGCADPEKFDALKGQQLAKEAAIDQIWPLMGYELKSKLLEAESAGDLVGSGEAELATEEFLNDLKGKES